jgi:AraC-like DNA-binding protein
MLREASKPFSRYILCAIETIKQHIDDHPFHCKTSASLFDLLSTPNRSTVEKAFKEIYGAGIKEYQVRQRLEASKKFLETGMSKKQVAAKCLYSGQASFCRAFKKEFNLTPTEWQSQYTWYNSEQ